MVDSKDALKTYLAEDNAYATPHGVRDRAIDALAQYPSRSIRKYLYYLRRQEYYINTARGSRLRGLLGRYYEGRKNRLGARLGSEIGPNCFGKGIKLWHAGGIVANASARIGEYCTLHGANCIGNNGKSPEAPRIGNYVDIGYGAVIIGDVEIADHVVIGANAVVNRSITVPGCTVVGVPARIVSRYSIYDKGKEGE